VDALIANWSIDRIESAAWFEEGDSALVFGSNLAGDSCTFELFRVPDDDVALFDFNIDWVSNSWWESVLPNEVQSQLWPEAEKRLVAWDSQVKKILTWLPSGQWKKGPGNDFEFEYAVLAFLKDSLSEFGGLKTNYVISKLLQIPLSTTVERVRESRNRGLLSVPGQGIRGHSVMTAKARKILKEKGVISA
jgi:hypothetical protein